jgi:hypothetical protein
LFLEQESPNAGEPYLQVLTGPITVAGDVIPLVGLNYQTESPIEISIDGHAVDRVMVVQGGKFFASVTTPSESGLHHITTIDGAIGKVINQTTVMLTEGGEREPPVRISLPH